ncbi:adenine deaminase C-terminal domain-containing protein [Evansella sp. AB-P1]|uniref:adenine deaminase n=1 Tax=Evansella sp. AB-P1 TaxID=3037653 RepID=UPI00241E854B|nr:adenine deaminase C-terminal domain-containing protein [Evansella sp. AB-P1]MDG5789284.1 adenine deaminase C-terminal domain-containing protein [Evansella sp. AB-P1]
MHIDSFIRNVQIYNSYFKTFIPGNAAINEGKFVYIGEDDALSLEAAEVVDGENQFMIPGLTDIHLHIESSMITPATFSSAVLQNGVTTIVAEPHELANVFGLKGVQEMVKASKECIVDIFTGIPSSVPSTQLETSGGSIDYEDIDLLMKENSEDIACLGEVMDFKSVISEPDGVTNQLLKKIREKYPKLVIEGHFPRLVGLDLCKFMNAGIGSDHTQQTIAGMEERMKQGMFIEIQEKSMTPEIMEYLITNNVKEHFCFITDDVMPDSFVKHGHLNHIVKKAIGMGMKPEDAIYAATFTPNRHMQLHDRGSIAPNKIADFLLVSDLQEFTIEEVYKYGVKVYDSQVGHTFQQKPFKFPNEFYSSVKISELSKSDFQIHAPNENGTVQVRAMMVSDGTTFTKEKIDELSCESNLVNYEESAYCFIGIFERYGKNGNRSVGLVGGDTIKRGAIATTYAHDHHNLLVIGKNEEDMAIAANEVIHNQGGYCSVVDGKILSSLKLPIGGILSDEPLEEVAKEVKRLRESMHDLGYKHYNPIMSLSTIALPVSPELKITDLGLVNVNEGKIVDLFV